MEPFGWIAGANYQAGQGCSVSNSFILQNNLINDTFKTDLLVIIVKWGSGL